jgi:hypothetical protein
MTRIHAPRQVSVHPESAQAVVAGTDHGLYCLSLETGGLSHGR